MVGVQPDDSSAGRDRPQQPRLQSRQPPAWRTPPTDPDVKYVLRDFPFHFRFCIFKQAWSKTFLVRCPEESCVELQ